ncbi:MAG: rhodanese-like domain-containing protein [Bradymonadales bacterium]|jgi:rhodanese-related sulfurtransferase
MDKNKTKEKNIKRTLYVIIRDAIIIVLFASVIAMVYNLIRSDGLEWVAKVPYEIFVPCPETLGTVEMIESSDPRFSDGRSLFIDARSEEEYHEWHYADALNLEYDYLDPIPEETMKYMSQNILKSGMARVIVYGDGEGEKGSSGYELGRELSGRGINNIYIVKGGVAALKELKP